MMYGPSPLLASMGVPQRRVLARRPGYAGCQNLACRLEMGGG